MTQIPLRQNPPRAFGEETFWYTVLTPATRVLVTVCLFLFLVRPIFAPQQAMPTEGFNEQPRPPRGGSVGIRSGARTLCWVSGKRRLHFLSSGSDAVVFDSFHQRCL